MITNSTSLRESFFDKAQETLVIFDKDLNFVDVNDAFLHSLHLNRENIIGKNLTEISPGIEETERYRLYKQVLQTGKSVIVDESTTHPSLGNFTSRITAFKLGDGLGLAILNITDLKEAIGELETFIYKTSHDMRSPISSILGLTHLAMIDTRSYEITVDYLKKIEQQAQLLKSVLDKLIDTARINHGSKVIHLIDFRSLVEDVKQSLTSMTGFKEIQFSIDINSTKRFYCDKPLLISLFQNLLDNAIKYKKENFADAYVRIVINDENEGVRIRVQDNGIGMTEDIQPRIFDMFFRGKVEGSGVGLGLYTVKHIVKSLNGHIAVESKEGIGTSFIVYLPSSPGP